jgi:hypothetical protein
MSDDLWFEHVAAVTGATTDERAPARLKSKIYSAMVARLSEAGPLLDLAETRRNGCGRLCVFEQLLTALPVSSGVPQMNPCRVCHARVLGERMDRAPIFWPGCPYAEFHRS